MFGLVISTFGTPPYVHLQLETARQLYPAVPVLVHDDCSPSIVELNALCAQYDADFSFNHHRLGHEQGDLSSFAHGLLWAQRHDVDVLVKFSRRFLPKIDWTSSLGLLVEEAEGKYAAFSSFCAHLRLPLRTEAIAIRTVPWMSVRQKIHEVSSQPMPGLVEVFMWNMAKKVNTTYSGMNGSYVYWELLGESRLHNLPNAMWYETNTPEAYAARAVELGLNYNNDDFCLTH